MKDSKGICPFCRIVRGDDPAARLVYQDPHTAAFFPINPATLGHTLVVPRTHIPEIWDLDEESAVLLTQATLLIAHVTRRTFKPDGLNIIQSNGEAASQTVPHLHVHVVPRWKNDAMGDIWPTETIFSKDEQDRAWKILRKECQKEASI
ncbi:HIT family protein [Glycomyces tenuis]|uniref:HIT family protein n=1 Tax=Glycomyces tenuis TaxID=58116 RepID=UPI001B7FE2F9|nr:HIT family protein [Glycomyces tenuis]